MFNRLLELTKEYATLSWRATTEEIAEVTRPLNEIKKELGFNELLEREWEKLTIYIRHIHQDEENAPMELLELEAKQELHLEELIKKRQIIVDLKKHYTELIENGEDVVLTSISDIKMVVLKELNIKTFILEDSSSALMHNLHQLKALGEVDIDLNVRTYQSEWRDEEVHKQGLRITIK